MASKGGKMATSPIMPDPAASVMASFAVVIMTTEGFFCIIGACYTSRSFRPRSRVKVTGAKHRRHGLL